MTPLFAGIGMAQLVDPSRRIRDAGAATSAARFSEGRTSAERK